MSDFTRSDVDSITFWRRDPNAVDRIIALGIRFEDGGTAQGRIDYPDRTFRTFQLDKKGCDAVRDFLFDRIHLCEELAPYRCFDYEDSPQDFLLSFFLKVTFKNGIYYAIKGKGPSLLPHFQEILAFFSAIPS